MGGEPQIDISGAGNYLTAEEKVFQETVPVFINVRDRLSCLERLLKWLERAGHRNITLIDNASTYPPLVHFLDRTNYRTLRLKKNLGHTGLWRVKELRRILATQWFLYTDPDVIPSETCPLNAVVHLRRLLIDFPLYLKAGLGLRLDDIPNHYHLKQKVIDWERRLIGEEIAPNVFEADVDTTFALYRPGTPYVVGPSIRLQGIYLAQHLPWYADSCQPDDEERYYRSHASAGVTTWNVYGRERYQRTTDPGGVAAQLRTSPHALLERVLNSYPGRIVSVLAVLRDLSGKGKGYNLRKGNLTSEQARQNVIAIIASDDWRFAWQLTEPLRQVKSYFMSFLGHWLRLE